MEGGGIASHRDGTVHFIALRGDVHKQRDAHDTTSRTHTKSKPGIRDGKTRWTSEITCMIFNA